MPSMKVVPYTFTFQANDLKTIDALEYVYLPTTTGTLDISFDGSNFAPLQLKRGYRTPDGKPIGRCYLRNSTGGAVIATLITGYGSVIDNNAGNATTGVQDVNIAGDALAGIPVNGAEAQGD